MEVTLDDRLDSEGLAQSRVGWVVAAIGFAGMAWWIWTWRNVQTLIDRHIETSGPLPMSDSELAALYANGTIPERQLSNELASLAGLYPWGPLPLFTAGLVAAGGILLSYRKRGTLTALGIGLTCLLVVVPLAVLGSSMVIALAILE